MLATSESMLERARDVLNTESKALDHLGQKLDQSFVNACRAILECQGRVIVTGMGKSGHVGGKIAATLASTGTPAFFVHPGEASHGDLGMITHQDIVLALSYSGQSEEVVCLLPALKRFGTPIIAMTGNQHSKLAQNGDIHLNVHVEKEACSLGLAPTTSTTVMLALGDALAMALLDARGFSKEDFAFSHPGGSLGRRLLLTVENIMHVGDDVPKVKPNTSVQAALLEMTRARLGITAITDDNNTVLGIFTDGDLRRALENDVDLSSSVEQVMTSTCSTLAPTTLAGEALRLMQSKKINAILVVDSNKKLVGAFNMHDLLNAGVI